VGPNGVSPTAGFDLYGQLYSVNSSQ
jgi:hypothetical protein